MNIPVHLRIAALAACVSFHSSVLAQATTTGEVMQSPFFEGANYASWTLSAPWRDDGAGNRLVLDVANFNAPGFYVAQGAGVNLTAQPNVTSLAGYDPATTRLTGFAFAGSQPFVQTFADGNFAGGDYRLYFEVTVTTSGGNYRAVSDQFTNPFSGAGVSLTPVFTWAGGGFLGDPAAASGGGIALNSISAITYTAVMQVVTPNVGAETAFFTLDNMNLAYEVTAGAIPEPSAFAALAGAGVLALGMVRRRGRAVTSLG